MHQDQDAVLDRLMSAQAYPHATHDIRRIETHISCVYLTGSFAYKVKKAVKLPYLDFSTLELRESACRDELALNRRLAPDLYHEVVSIGERDGTIRIGGTPAVEYAVKITQFPDGAIADELILSDSLQADEVTVLARDIAAFHEGLPGQSIESPKRRIVANLAELTTSITGPEATALEEIGNWMTTELDRSSKILADRNASGRVRECHGDLHLGNIVRIDNRLVAFDCLEFSKDLRTIDVIDEVAFLAMDLIAYDRRDLAIGFLSSYLEQTGDYEGLRALPLYVAHRALVRAKVESAGLRHQDASESAETVSRYLETARAQTETRRPLCLITSGLSGSGKTFVARRLAPVLEAIHLRSDVERKRLQGMKPTERTNDAVAEGIYDQATTQATYRHLAACAEAALSGGVDVIVDASFIDHGLRSAFRRLAEKSAADFVILHCDAPEDLLRSRILERYRQGSDASDANLAVLEHQLENVDRCSEEEQSAVIKVDTSQPLDIARTVRAIEARCVQPSLSSTSY